MTTVCSLTKQDEIDHLQEIIDGLPAGGYLQSIFGAIQVSIETAIKNDFGFVDWQTRVDEQKEHAKQITELTAQKMKLQAELVDLQRQVKYSSSVLCDIKQAVSKIQTALAC